MVASLKDEILRMAAGNLRDNVPEMGQDEIGIIAEELDNLRTALQDTWFVKRKAAGQIRT